MGRNINGFYCWLACIPNVKRDSILMVVDRFTKYAAFIPTTSKLIASGLADFLIAYIYSRYGISKGIISDKGSLFTSKFWAIFCYYLAIKRKFSIVYHFQINKQTKRIN
jgi:hypothetical protein